MRRVILFPRPFLALLVVLAVLLSGRAGASPSPSASAAAEEGGYDPDHVLVAFQAGTPAHTRAATHAMEGGRVENRFDHLNLDVVRVPQRQDPPAVAQRYERNPNVVYAHPNWEVQLLSSPDDTLFGDLWGLHNTGQLVPPSLVAGTVDADIDAPEGWDRAFDAGSFPSSGGVRWVCSTPALTAPTWISSARRRPAPRPWQPSAW